MQAAVTWRTKYQENASHLKYLTVQFNRMKKKHKQNVKEKKEISEK